MKQTSMIFDLFPHHIFQIRRLLASDAKFREICGDLETAEAALRHWQSQQNPDDRRVREYRALRDELAEELKRFFGITSSGEDTVASTGAVTGQDRSPPVIWRDR